MAMVSMLGLEARLLVHDFLTSLARASLGCSALTDGLVLLDVFFCLKGSSLGSMGSLKTSWPGAVPLKQAAHWQTGCEG